MAEKGYTSTFDIDLRRGLYGEGLLMDLLRKGNELIEVKTDYRAHETGNIAVELECRGKPSGLTTTEADYWAFIIPGLDNSIILQRKERVMKLCQDKPTVMVGDGKASKCVLLPIRSMWGKV